MSQQQPDGGMKPVDHGLAACHKAPFALALMGEEERAARVCVWAMDQLMDDDGDFSRTYPRVGLMARFYQYPNAWLAAGAHKIGVFSLSCPAANFLEYSQHPETGGFFTAGPSAKMSDEQDLLSTAVVGLGCLYCGKVDTAIRAGEFLIWLLDNQPASNALCMVVRDGDKVVTDSPSAEEERYYIFHVGRPEQFYAPPALAALFLAKLYEASGNDTYLTAAQLYVNFPESAGDDKYTSITSGFFGWAAAELFALTGNRNYMRIASEVADGLIEQQLENGSWLQASMSADLESDVVDGTAEHIIVLRGITRALALGA